MNTYSLLRHCFTLLIGLSIAFSVHASTTGVRATYAVTEATRTCTGAVHTGKPGALGAPLPGVTVRLYGSNNANEQGTVLDETTTDAEGRYILTGEATFEYYHVVETDPPGYVSTGALSEVGQVVDANWIRYTAQMVGCGPDYFLDKEGEPAPDPEEIAVSFDRVKYDPQQHCLSVTVVHPAQNQDPSLKGSVQVDVMDAYPAGQATGDRVQLSLDETAVDSGVFTLGACLPLQIAAQQNDGILQVNPGDLISVVYQDPNNPAQPQSPDELGLAADFALIAGGQATGVFTYSVDPAILPPELANTPGVAPGESPRPLALAVDPQGMPQLFGQDQVVFRPEDQADLARFLRERNGQVVETIPFVEGDGTQTYYLIRVDPAQTNDAELVYLMELAHIEGQVTFSSREAAGLVALIMEEQLGGRFITHNPVAWYLGNPITFEAGFSDGFAAPWINDADIRLREAILYLDLIDRNQAGSVNLAVIDGGFSPNADVITPTVEGDCSQEDCSGSSTGRNPVSPHCAGGGGPGCDWHGMGVASIAGAVADNSFGALGVAGHGRDGAGADGSAGVANLMLYKMDFPYMTTVARAINRATDQGASIINISSGFPCTPLIGVNICDGGNRALIIVLCDVLGGIIRPLLPPLISELLTRLSCSSLLALFQVSGVADADALQDALTRAAGAGVVVVASGPENITLPVLGMMGPFDASVVQMLPCVHPGVICVGMVVGTSGARTAEPTNPIGSAIALWGPSFGLVTTPNPDSTGATDTFGGTSAAAPFVAGVAALMRAADPTLTPGAVRAILQGTSTPLAILPPGCTPNPGGLSACVGVVDALAAVRAAAAVPLSCTAWDEIINAGDTINAAVPITGVQGLVGSQASISGDLAVHAITNSANGDADFYSFQPPSVDGSASTRVEIELTVGNPAVGELMLELYRSDRPDPILTARTFNDQIVLRPDPLFTDLTYYVRVAAVAPAALNDNCYSALTVRVVEAGPAQDAYENNDRPANPASPNLLWVHERFHDPDIVAHGTVPPAGAGVNGWMSDDLWTLRIPGLSLHSQDDRDYFRIPLPDPASLAYTGYPDIDPDLGVVEPMPECGESSRRGAQGTMTETLTFYGAVTMRVNPGGDGGEEDFTLYGKPNNGGLTVSLRCPRSDLNLQDLLVDYGVRNSPRDAALTYDMAFYYGVNISRLPSAIPASWGDRPFAGLPCPDGGVFPYCDIRVSEIVQMDLRHPLDPSDDPLCSELGCRTVLVFEWMEAGLFEISLETLGEYAFGLYDARGERIADARPFDGPQAALNSATLRSEAQELKLSVSLEPGLYAFIADGPPGAFTMRFTPPPVPKDRQPTGSDPTLDLRLHLPLLSR